MELRQSPTTYWPPPEPEPVEPPEPERSGVGPSVFISHATEDKADVARPIADGLRASGWTVWLDEYEITVGDDLYHRIDHGLARSRCGVVILSEHFFAKRWTKQELSALAARETVSGEKVILPVWHGIDVEYLTKVAPMLANRYGATTEHGIRQVVQELTRALVRETRSDSPTGENEPVFRSARPQDPLPPPHVPLTPEARDELVRTRPGFWEYALFASELYLRRAELEPLWLDYELSIPTGPQRRMSKDQAIDFLSGTFDAYGQIVAQIDRVLAPEVQARAFGPPGEPGDPLRIKHLAKAILDVYERLMRTAAELRNQLVPNDCRDVYELAARYVDLPLQQIREFVDTTVGGVNEVIERASNASAGSEPIRLVLELAISVDERLQKQYTEALAILREGT
jgi:hypothetical protein